MTTRRLAAILAADVVGFSSMMEKAEEGTSRIRTMRREVVEPALSAHQGRLVKPTGDGFLESGPPPLGLHILMVQDAPTKTGNMLGNFENGTIAPIVIIAGKRD